MKKSTVLIALAILTATAVFGFELKPEHVVVVYNEDSPDGRFLAEAYADLRQIPPGNLVALQCATNEAITRDDYEKTIRKPLREVARKGNWWIPSSRAMNPMIDRKVFSLVMMKGIPLKIVDDPALKKTGISTDAAAVDSELALLGFDGVPSPGMIRNAYYNRDEDFVGSGFPYFLVTRIDAPDRDTCLSMMHDAVDVEKKGLWGRLVVDTGGPYTEGNDWMSKIAADGEREGIPVMVDTWGQTLSSHYPLGNDVALYFGWYTGQANGPFLSPSFRLKPGAVAVHIQSFSASTVREKDKFWSGPLLVKGAAVTLGNVFEPYLGTTHHLDLFFERLLDGYTVAEAAGMSIPVWSWQNVVFGDPLYRPFAKQNEKKIVKSEVDKYFQAWRLAVQNWGDNPGKLKQELEDAAAASSGSMFFYESLGNRAMQKNEWAAASEYFSKALVSASAARDRIRLRMSRAEVSRRQGNIKQCLEELGALEGLYPETEWTAAFVEWKTWLLPPPPKPAPKPTPSGGDKKKPVANAPNTRK